MKLQELKLEIVRLGAADVIATSGVLSPDKLTVAKSKNDVLGDLTVTFMGYGFYSFDDLNSALEYFHLGSNTDTPSWGNDETSLANFFAKDAYFDDGNDAYWFSLNNVDGGYTWYASENIWKHD